jgi:NAD(P)-dependent dehydrogenase (short-subunit alcohol dehydrogenase family)
MAKRGDFIMDMGLKGRVIVITGAARGIGRAIAELAAAEGADCLVLTDRDAQALTPVAAALSAAPIVADLADPAAAARVIPAVVAQFGQVDGLINAAGITTRASIASGTLAEWDSLFAVNARAPFLLMQAALCDMLGRGAGGAIVNILSINALCGAPDLGIYSASKGALATLTRNAANAHMADRIRVNGINLGWVPTESEHHMQSHVLGHGPDWHLSVAARMPLGRMLTAAEVARLAIFLLSDASTPMSGSVIDFDQFVPGVAR